MNKMKNPEMEVVRFGAEDVIATSDCGYTNFTHLKATNTFDGKATVGTPVGNLYTYLQSNGSFKYKADATAQLGSSYQNMTAGKWYHQEGKAWVECAEGCDHAFLEQYKTN